MAELDRGRVAAVLAADAQMNVGACLTAKLDSRFNQFADALLIEVCKRIGFIDLVLVIVVKELAGVVTAEAKRHLRQVVRAEAEEFGLLGDLIGSQRGARDLLIIFGLGRM